MLDSLNQIFADVLELPVGQINDFTSPANTPEWDSLASVKLTVAIEQAYDLRLGMPEVLAMNTVGAARAILKKRAAKL